MSESGANIGRLMIRLLHQPCSHGAKADADAPAPSASGSASQSPKIGKRHTSRVEKDAENKNIKTLLLGSGRKESMKKEAACSGLSASSRTPHANDTILNDDLSAREVLPVSVAALLPQVELACCTHMHEIPRRKARRDGWQPHRGFQNSTIARDPRVSLF